MLQRFRGVQQRHALRPPLLCVSLRPGLRRFREVRESQGVEASGCLDDFTTNVHKIPSRDGWSEWCTSSKGS